MHLFSVDFGWIAPICGVSYVRILTSLRVCVCVKLFCSQGTKFLLNTVAAPLVLLGLVQATWWFGERAEKKKNAKNAAGGLQQTISAGHAEEIALETKASRSSDFYFAFFLTCK